MVRFGTLSLLSFCLLSTTAWATPVPVQKPTSSVAPVIVQKETIKQPTTIVPQKISNTAPLTKREINLYKDIFELQSKEQWAQADTLLSKVKNNILVGHVLATRYAHSSYDMNDDEKKQWMAHYADHPQSTTLDKKSSTARNNVMGTLADLRYFSNGSKYISEKYNNAQRYELRSVKRSISKNLDNGKVSAALGYFNNHRVQDYIDPIDKAQILAGMASQYLYLGYIDKARNTALKALKASKQAPLAGWVAGLIAWMDNDMVASARYFTIAANAPYASPWMTSAASYWGARASTRAGLYKDVSTLLAKAVKNQRTFYGIIATKALGYGYDFNWTMPQLSAKDKDILYQYPSGARALALADINQLKLAEAELFNLPVKTNSKLANAAIAMAHHYNLAGYALRFSSVIENPAGGYYDAGLFPISSWTKHVKQSDTALLNAFIRQESKFIAQAHNKTGATGLMQIMPETAAFVSGKSVYKSPQGRDLLSNPKTNVTIGSDYLKHLTGLQTVDNDLFGLTIAYNAGPGKFRRWKNELKVDDPLLFIELIPASETRAFVERVVTNYWVYQMQMEIDPKTLTAVASGAWPKLD
jgi:soluble lytic murein transglycosylase